MASTVLELTTRRSMWAFSWSHFMFSASVAHPSFTCTSAGRSCSSLRIKQGNKWSFIASLIIVNRHLTGPLRDIYIPVGLRM